MDAAPPWPLPPRVARRRHACLGALVAAVGWPSAALAIQCGALPSPTYGLGGSAQKPLIARVATALAQAAPPTTVIYQAPGACFGINALISRTPLTGTASYWDTNGKEQQCDLPLAGVQPNFANMGNFATTCPGVARLPDGLGDFRGPIAAVDFLVPVASQQQSISAEAAYLAFGLGKAGKVTPWVDESFLIKRDQNSFATLLVSLATGVPPAAFKGVDAKSNAGTVMLVGAAQNPEAAIGYASSDVADANRGSVRVLAYQHKGQSCGYWPDSTVTAFDKANVRSGQYWLWAQTHFFAPVDGGGTIPHADTARFVGLFTRAVTVPGIDMLAIEAKSGNVPECAMHARRDGDLGPLASYLPAAPCGCAFEKAATGATGCTACKINDDCKNTPQPTCRFGYCEVR